MTIHTSNCIKERQYGNVRCYPSTSANQSLLYKPIPNYIYYSSEHYHTGVDQRENIQTEFFSKTFSLSFLPPTGFHMVGITVNKSSFYLLPFNRTRTNLICMSNGQPQNRFGCTCAPCLEYVVTHSKRHHMEVFLRQKCKQTFLAECQLECFTLGQLLYGRFWNVLLNLASFPVAASRSVPCRIALARVL